MSNYNKIDKPYRGAEPYVFISYSHKDKAMVFEVIRRLQKDNCHVWYDEGIEPGTDWSENIASHIEQCSVFIALLSKWYPVSSNCKNELNYAGDLKKTRLLIYLEEGVVLSGGMLMELSRIQAIYKYKYTYQEAFFEKLYDTPQIKECFEDKFYIAKSDEKLEEDFEVDVLLGITDEELEGTVYQSEIADDEITEEELEETVYQRFGIMHKLWRKIQWLLSQFCVAEPDEEDFEIDTLLEITDEEFEGTVYQSEIADDEITEEELEETMMHRLWRKMQRLLLG